MWKRHLRWSALWQKGSSPCIVRSCCLWSSSMVSMTSTLPVWRMQTLITSLWCWWWDSTPLERQLSSSKTLQLCIKHVYTVRLYVIAEFSTERNLRVCVCGRQVSAGAGYPWKQDRTWTHHRLLHCHHAWGGGGSNPRERPYCRPQQAVPQTQSVWKHLPQQVRRVYVFTVLCNGSTEGARCRWNRRDYVREGMQGRRDSRTFFSSQEFQVPVPNFREGRPFPYLWKKRRKGAISPETVMKANVLRQDLQCTQVQSGSQRAPRPLRAKTNKWSHRHCGA